MEIDVFFAKHIQPRKKSYCICPNIINQAQDYSTIESRNVNYSLNTNMLVVKKFDIVLVVHSKDIENLRILITSIQYYISHYRNIYLVANKNFIEDPNLKFIPPENYPFSRDDVSDILAKKNYPQFKFGWYYQQLLKLYAPIAIKDLTEHFLVIDADVIFLNFFRLFNEKNIPYFTVGYEHHDQYFNHISRLLPSLKCNSKFSGISHHMIFNKNILSSFFDEVFQVHKCDFWKAFLSCLKIDSTFCNASEYEIYFNYVLNNYHHQYIVREQKWKNVSNNNYSHYMKRGYMYVANHDYMHNDYTKYVAE